jgi:hypothetical protein
MNHRLFTLELPIEGSGFDKWSCRNCMQVWTVGYSDRCLYERLMTEECPAELSSESG